MIYSFLALCLVLTRGMKAAKGITKSKASLASEREELKKDLQSHLRDLNKESLKKGEKEKLQNLLDSGKLDELTVKLVDIERSRCKDNGIALTPVSEYDNDDHEQPLLRRASDATVKLKQYIESQCEDLPIEDLLDKVQKKATYVLKDQEYDTECTKVLKNASSHDLEKIITDIKRTLPEVEVKERSLATQLATFQAMMRLPESAFVGFDHANPDQACKVLGRKQNDAFRFWLDKFQPDRAGNGQELDDFAKNADNEFDVQYIMKDIKSVNGKEFSLTDFVAGKMEFKNGKLIEVPEE